MLQQNWMPKVQQLEQLKIDFDDGENMLPKQINSKKMFDNGPTNNKRFYNTKQKAFGFVQPEPDSEEGEEDIGKQIFYSSKQQEILQ